MVKVILEWAMKKIEARADAWTAVDYNRFNVDKRAWCPVGCRLCGEWAKCDRCGLPLCESTGDGTWDAWCESGVGWCAACVAYQRLQLRHEAARLRAR